MKRTRSTHATPDGTCDLARPDLPAHHPQNVPLERWSDGWLKLSVCEHVGEDYLFADLETCLRHDWPVGRTAMIAFLRERGDVPACERA